MFLATSALAEQRLPLVIVDGQLCARVTLRSGPEAAPAHVVLDVGTRAPLLLHERMAALLAVRSGRAVTVEFDQTDLTLRDLPVAVQRLEPLEELTRRHAEALNQIPASAVLGLPAFAGLILDLDLAEAQASFRPRPAAFDLEAAHSDDRGQPGTVLAFEPRAYGYWLEARGPDGQALRVRLTSAERDTRIHGETAARLGRPGGDLAGVMLGSIDLTRYAVLRPSDLSTFPEPRPDITLGTDLLAHFRVTIDVEGGYLRLVPVREPSLPLEEQRLFVARAAGDADAVEAWLNRHADARLAGEAAETLLAMRLAATPADADAIRRAIQRRADVEPLAGRAMAMVRLADELIAMEGERSDAYELAEASLDAAEPSAAEDPDGLATAAIQARRGLIALLREDYATARRYLLSAMFATPRDPYVNLWLGRLYEKTRQPVRAWSRYLESALHDDPPIGAWRGLNRMTQDVGFRTQMTMAEAESFVQGRLPTFAPPRVPPDEGPRLVELVTSTRSELADAAELAFAAIRDHAATMTASPICLAWHVDDPLLGPAPPAALQDLVGDRVPAIVLDRQSVVRPEADAASPSVWYEAIMQAWSSARSEGRPLPLTLDLEVGLSEDGTALAMRTRWDGGAAYDPSADFGRVHAVLIEHVVMARGVGKQLFHHGVVRSRLSPADGWPVAAGTSGDHSVALSLEWSGLEDRLSKRLEAWEAGGEERMLLRPTRIDPRLCEVVVWVQAEPQGPPSIVVSQAVVDGAEVDAW